MGAYFEDGSGIAADERRALATGGVLREARLDDKSEAKGQGKTA
jgi:hypothetical protein